MKPHKHANLIKAWADGAEIECWFNDHWEFRAYPSWTPHLDYRLKPPSDVVRFVCHDVNANKNCDLYMRVYLCKQNVLNTAVTNQLKITFDGSTDKIKSVEVV